MVCSDGIVPGTRELPVGGMAFLPRIPVTAWARGTHGGHFRDPAPGYRCCSWGAEMINTLKLIAPIETPLTSSFPVMISPTTFDIHGSQPPKRPPTRSHNTPLFSVSLRPAAETESRTGRPCPRCATIRSTTKGSNKTNLQDSSRGLTASAIPV